MALYLPETQVNRLLFFCIWVFCFCFGVEWNGVGYEMVKEEHLSETLQISSKVPDTEEIQ